MADSNVYELVITINNNKGSLDSKKNKDDSKSKNGKLVDKLSKQEKKSENLNKESGALLVATAISLGKQVVANIGTLTRNSTLQNRINGYMSLLRPSTYTNAVSTIINYQTSLEKEIHKAENMSARSGYINRSR